MRAKRARSVTNGEYAVGDPRRKEPGEGSNKRAGRNWRRRFHASLGFGAVRKLPALPKTESMWVTPTPLTAQNASE